MVCDVALQLTHTIRRFFSSKDVLLFCSTFSLTTLWVRIRYFHKMCSALVNFFFTRHERR